MVIQFIQHKTHNQTTPIHSQHAYAKHKLTTTTYVNMHSMHERHTNNRQLRDTMSWWKVPPVSSSGGGGRLNDFVAAVEPIEHWSFYKTSKITGQAHIKQNEQSATDMANHGKTNKINTNANRWPEKVQWWPP